MDAESVTLGLIAGDGQLPRDIAEAARRRGHRVVAVALRGCCDASLSQYVEQMHWLEIGELQSLFEVFRKAGVREAVMAGKVSKAQLFGGVAGRDVKLDPQAVKSLASIADHADDSILGVVADALRAHGIELRPQAELVPELFAGVGPLGACTPTRDQWRDIEFGFGIAKGLGKLDVGQSVVIKNRAVMAVEAIEGTDQAIERGAALAGPGACVVKVAKPSQDPRFDLPAIGPVTLQVMQKNAVAVLAFEADATLVMDRATLVADADAAGIAIVGVSGESLAGSLEGAS